MNRLIRLSISSFAVCLIGVPIGAKLSATAVAPGEQAPPPALATDKTTYAPGEPVVFTGTGWQPTQPLTLTIHEAADPLIHLDRTVSVFADDSGNFADESFSPASDEVGLTLVATASDGVSEAGATFTVAPRPAQIQTDKFDYKPEDLALITGSGFLANEQVVVQVIHANGVDDGHGHEAFDVLADADGGFVTGWYVDPDDSLGAILTVTAVGSASGRTATTIFTDTTIMVVDDGGADDEPTQREDLSSMMVDFGGLPAALAVGWSWDDTGFTGSTSGDACSLYDTDGDGKANFALCASVGGNPARLQGTRLFSCGNTQSDRCGAPSTEISAFASSCTAAIVNSDPFTSNRVHSRNDCKVSNDCIARDTVATCGIRTSDFGNARNLFLINVCSYRSGNPAVDPSDCVAAPNSGFLTIQTIDREGDHQLFTFTLGSGQQSNDGRSTFPVTGTSAVSLVSFAPGAYTLSELVPADWQLDSASCEVNGSPVGTRNGDSISNVLIQSGLNTVCTFQDSLKPSHLSVVKHVINDNGGTQTAANFTINVAGPTVTGGPGQESPGASYEIHAGTYAVSETGPSGYTPSFAGDCDGSGRVALTPGQVKTCTIVNDDEAPTLSISKAADASPVLVGSTIGFLVTVTNTGTGIPAHDVSVADSLPTSGGLSWSIDAAGSNSGCAIVSGVLRCTFGDLPSGGSKRVHVSSPTTRASCQEIDNTATATSSNGNNSPQASASIFVQCPALSVTKTAGPATYDRLGQTIGYSYTVANTGNVTLAGPVAVSDDKATVSCPAGPLGPTVSIVCAATYAITQADLDAGFVTNTASAHATFNASQVDSATAQATVTAIQKPALSIAKSASQATYSQPGSVIGYTYVLTNVGNVTLSAPYSVNDDKAAATCPSTPGLLGPGASVTCTAAYTITTSDVFAGAVTNTAVGFAKFGINPVKSNAAQAVVSLAGTVVTNSSLCNPDIDPAPGTQFRLIFMQDPASPSTYRLNASNPGQMYDNVFARGGIGEAMNLSIAIPFPFVTHGAVPIQVHSAFSSRDGCFVPGDDITSQFRIDAGSTPSASGAATIGLGDYSPQAIGSTSIVTVSGTVPPSGLVYVTIHLAYGEKNTIGWTRAALEPGASDFNDGCQGTIAADATCSGLALVDGAAYAFSDSHGTSTFSETVTSENNFKRDPGIAGFVLASDGTPLPGMTVNVYDAASVLVGTAVTDQDGVYFFAYKYTGKGTTFTAELESGTSKWSQSVPLKSNGFAVASFTVQ